MTPRRPGRIRTFMRAVRRRLPWLRGQEPPPDPRGPDDPALVPTGPPRRRPPAAAAALELPTELDPRVYPTETEAVGTALLDEPEQRTRVPKPRRRLFPWRRSAAAS